jgi:succinate-semialdehyde dehydrogenase/glutarate-semialdehyde dehydrogenase
LGGGVVPRDIARAKHVATAIECGSVFINDNIRSDPRLPLSKSKESGYRR